MRKQSGNSKGSRKCKRNEKPFPSSYTITTLSCRFVNVCSLRGNLRISGLEIIHQGTVISSILSLYTFFIFLLCLFLPSFSLLQQFSFSNCVSLQMVPRLILFLASSSGTYLFLLLNSLKSYLFAKICIFKKTCEI